MESKILHIEIREDGKNHRRIYQEDHQSSFVLDGGCLTILASSESWKRHRSGLFDIIVVGERPPRFAEWALRILNHARWVSTVRFLIALHIASDPSQTLKDLK